MSAVEVAGLKHQFGAGEGAREALAGIDFSVQAGKLFGILGPNGGGKTTLFRILSTALRATAGTARVLGFDLRENPAAAREKLGVVFQNPSLDKKLTVWENLIHQGHLYGLSGAELRRRAHEFATRLGVGDREESIVETLSGGLARRVEVAKSLLHHPSVLLMDEPTTGLDPGARRDLWDYLRRLTQEGVTVLVTTHIMEEADRCDELVLLDEGRVAAMGTPAALKTAIRGDVIVAATPDPEKLAAGIKARFHAEAAVLDGAVRLEKNEGHAFVPALVEAFPGLVTSVSVGKPTLEDVFVHYTGHKFWTERGKSS